VFERGYECFLEQATEEEYVALLSLFTRLTYCIFTDDLTNLLSMFGTPTGSGPA